MHRRVQRRTGSGKTSSILWPQVLQDAPECEGELVVDAKGLERERQDHEEEHCPHSRATPGLPAATTASLRAALEGDS
jgi:hypothetical protein